MDNVKIPAIRQVDGGYVVSQVYVVYQDINDNLYTREQLKQKQFQDLVYYCEKPGIKAVKRVDL
jgi:hypothetical protein